MTPIQLRRALIDDPEIPVTFIEWLWGNHHVWEAFEAEAMKIIARGFDHYSARTIIHVLRHHSLVQEDAATPWKLNDHLSPYLARAFNHAYPQHSHLFKLRKVR